MMICEPGDIVDVPFPFADSAQTKLRPALVLSTARFQEKNGCCILMMVTSAERSRWDSDLEIADWRAAGLRKPSVLRWKIFTLDERLLRSRRGTLSVQDRARLQARFGEYLPWSTTTA